MSKLVMHNGLTVALALGVAACAGNPPPAPPVAVKAAGTSYILASGDRVRITVYGEDRLSGEFPVSTAGQISFPLIGNVDVAGLTLGDLQMLLGRRLSDGYLKDPRVTAEFVTYRPYYVQGEVARPGQFNYVDGLTLRQAIASAGGFTYRAKRDQIFLVSPGSTQEYSVDLKKDANRLVQPGEIIRVGERFF